MEEVKKEKPAFWKRKVGILGKQIPVMALLLLAVAGLGSATLLAYFGTITTEVTVYQAVTLMGGETHTIPESAPGGEEFCYLHKLQNDASVDIDVGFDMTCTCTPGLTGDCTGQGAVCDGVYQTIYTVPETITLNLCAKDPTTWECIEQGATATLEFDPVNPTFKGTLTTTGLTSEIQYALIYYPDQADRFDPSKWNGAGGEVITTFTGDQTGLAIDVDLGRNLPSSLDWNVNPIPDYCYSHNGFDDYVHCKGAKLWIVKTSDLDSGTLPLVTWNPTAWLFEEDLIVYSDCDETPENIAVDMEYSGSVTSLTTKSRETTPFLVCYDFDVAIAPGTYTLTTNILPPQ